MKTVYVKFSRTQSGLAVTPSRRELSEKEYAYKWEGEAKAGDIAIVSLMVASSSVHSGGRTYSVVEVMRVTDEADPLATKWLLGVYDQTAHEEREKREREKSSLLAKMMDKANDATRLLAMRELAKVDTELADMLAKYDTL